MAPKQTICTLCGNEIESGGHRDFDEATKRVIVICRDCRKAQVNQAARDAHEDSGNRASESD